LAKRTQPSSEPYELRIERFAQAPESWATTGDRPRPSVFKGAHVLP
jgi:hypothetical protein